MCCISYFLSTSNERENNRNQILEISWYFINIHPIWNLQDMILFNSKDLQGLPVKKIHGDFWKFFRGTFKSQGISGVISGASSNSGVFQGFQGFQGSLATLLLQTQAKWKQLRLLRTPNQDPEDFCYCDVTITSQEVTAYFESVPRGWLLMG